MRLAASTASNASLRFQTRFLQFHVTIGRDSAGGTPNMTLQTVNIGNICNTSNIV